ncbi:MAG: MFS transporter [Pseudomonadota bacterium]|uniref:MFS transporter n=1 Tax=Alcanivorax sp. TaxID=1872427 RepID=UPI00243B9CBE|nr:MFS transporter [Alcanivorax sp.]MED5239255.1 MFS transporter [Pseudomonadota bacterium]MEE3321906.1 MFS transporter [Pseudomonadota bacterium]
MTRRPLSERASPLPYYWRLSGFYFFYFGLLGALVPYWSLYLKDLGFSAAGIGALMAIPQLTKIGAPNLWGWLADRSGQRLRIIRAGNLLAALAFMPVFWVDTFWNMAFLLIAFSFFWNAVLAQFEVLTLQSLGDQAHRYSHVRLWGSVGFIVSVLVLGEVLDRAGTAFLPWVLSGFLWLLWLGTLTLPAGASGTGTRGGEAPSLWSVLARREVSLFLVASFLMQMSHGPYYTFFSIHLENMGFSKMVTGALWALGVLAEVGLFLIMHQLMRRFSIPWILTASLLMAALRWLVIGACGDSMPWLILAQCLHAASFGSFHAASIAWVHRQFGAPLAGQGQALYSSLGFGAGWAAGAGISGLLWPVWGVSLFFGAAAIAVLAALLLFTGVIGAASR